MINTIVTGDARELAKQIPDGSVDLIFTDPPYPKEYLPLYDWLATEAARILKPDGFLLAYAGTYWKAEVIKRLTAHMDYYFDFILLNGGNSPIMWARKVISRHKSIIALRKYGSDGQPHTNVLSFWNGGGEDKRFHTWGQDESSARYYIDCFSKPGDIVFDPFVGGGTTCAVAKQLKRQFIGFEIIPEMAEIARARIENAHQPIFEEILSQAVML